MTRHIYLLQIALSLGAVWWFLRNDVADYAVFKLLTRSSDRRRRYLAWTVKSAALFSGLSLLNLFFLGRLGSPFTLPTEFGRVSAALRSVSSHAQPLHAALFVGMGCGVLAGVILGIVASRKQKKASAPSFGDVEPLLPRNGAETACVALMSVNAGVSEELFFRLVLPLLLTSLFGNVWLCFVIAGLLFGLCHLYQGPAGVAATTALGLLMSAIYLGTGSLFIAMTAHAGLDLFNMIVRPWLHRVLSSAIPART